MNILANLDIYAFYESSCPVFRIWINDNLYSEREFWADWTREYVEEAMSFELEPGEHTIILETIASPLSKIWAERLVLKYENTEKVLTFPLDPQHKQIIKFTIE